MTVVELRRTLEKFRDDARVMVRCNGDDLCEVKSVAIPTDDWLHMEDVPEYPLVVLNRG
jgi:hypothetical protein